MIAKENMEQLIEMDRNQRPWFDRVNKYERRRLGEPWNSQQMQELQDRDLEPVGINLCIRIVDTIVSNLHSDNSGVAFTPIGESDRNIAYLLQALIDGYRNFNGHDANLKRVLESQFSVGIGMFHVDRDNNPNNPFGTITRYGDFNSYRWDSGHNSMYWDDLQRLMYCTSISVKEAIARTGKKYSTEMEARQDILNIPEDYYSYLYQRNTFGIEGKADKIENNKVLYVESYEKTYKNYQKLLMPDGNDFIIPILPEEELKACEDDELRNAYSYFHKHMNAQDAQDLILEIKEYGAMEMLKLNRIVKHVSIGNCDVGSYTLPCSRFPVVPYIDSLLGWPEGRIRFIDPINQALNQTLVLLINNGRLLSTPIILAQDGVVRHQSLMKALGAPYGLVTYKAKDQLNPGASKPEFIWAPPTGGHFTELMNILQSASEQDTGIYGSFQGNPAAALETHSTTTSLNSLALQKLMPTAKVNQKANAILAEIEKDFITEYSDYDMVMRLKIDNDDLFENIISNGIGTPEDGGGAYNVVVPVNKRLKEGGKRIIKNNLRDAKNSYTVTIRSAPSTHSRRERWADDLRMLIQQMGNPEYAMVAGKWLAKITELPFAQQISKEMDVVKKLDDELRDAKDVIKQLQSDLLNSQKKQATAQIGQQTSAIVQHTESKMDKLYNDNVLKLKEIALKMKSGAATPEEAEKNAKDMEEVLNVLEKFLNRESEVNEPADQTKPEGV